jgi:hypothetical protein
VVAREGEVNSTITWTPGAGPPPHEGEYLCTVDGGTDEPRRVTMSLWYAAGNWIDWNDQSTDDAPTPLAWAPMPEPWEGEQT